MLTSKFRHARYCKWFHVKDQVYYILYLSSGQRKCDSHLKNTQNVRPRWKISTFWKSVLNCWIKFCSLWRPYIHFNNSLWRRIFVIKDNFHHWSASLNIQGPLNKACFLWLQKKIVNLAAITYKRLLLVAGSQRTIYLSVAWNNKKKIIIVYRDNLNTSFCLYLFIYFYMARVSASISFMCNTPIFLMYVCSPFPTWPPWPDLAPKSSSCFGRVECQSVNCTAQTVLHCTAQTVLHCTALNCTALHWT